jgi:hypothetical protein
VSFLCVSDCLCWFSSQLQFESSFLLMKYIYILLHSSCIMHTLIKFAQLNHQKHDGKLPYWRLVSRIWGIR